MFDNFKQMAAMFPLHCLWCLEPEVAAMSCRGSPSLPTQPQRPPVAWQGVLFNPGRDIESSFRGFPVYYLYISLYFFHVFFSLLFM